MQTGRMPRRADTGHAGAARAIVAVYLAFSLAACGGEEGFDTTGGSLPPNGGNPPGGPQANAAAVIGELTDETATTFARGSLAMISNLVIVGHIADTIVREHIDLLGGNVRDSAPIAQCAGSPRGFGVETNEVSYREVSSGFALPAGRSLHAAFWDCTFEGVRITGTLDIAGITRSGDPTGPGDWQVQGWLVHSPLEIYHTNDTLTSITDQMQFTLAMNGGVLTMTLSIDADEDAGMIGGLNAQHTADPPPSPDRAINYQLRPFHIRTVDDPHAGVYTVTVAAHPEGPGTSTLSRYTTAPNAEVLAGIATTPGTPLTWQGGRPASYTDTPASGEIRFAETCDGCGHLLITVEDDGATLTMEAGGSVTTEYRAWETLISAPEAP